MELAHGDVAQVFHENGGKVAIRKKFSLRRKQSVDMLLSLTVGNLYSFKEKVTVSFVATTEKQHSSHIACYPPDKPRPKRFLPAAVFFGGNASGKSNLIKAIKLAQTMVVEGKLERKFFKLDKSCADKPSEICFHILAAEKEFEYAFSFNDTEIVEESLVLIRRASRRLLFARKVNTETVFSDELGTESLKLLDSQILLPSQLLLHVISKSKIIESQPLLTAIFSWFRDSLKVFSPDQHFHSYFHGDPYKEFGEMLSRLDTGIDRLDEKEVSFDSFGQLPKAISSIIENNERVSIGRSNPGNSASMPSDYFCTANEGGEKKLFQVVPMHASQIGPSIEFSFEEESDGTRRLFELLPFFIYAAKSKKPKVIIIDEADRCVHPLLIEKLICDYLDICGPRSRNQLIITTHASNLMTQAIFRRDEVYLVTRRLDGSSVVDRISDFDISKDEDIRKQYLNSMFGGTPFLPESNLYDVAKNSVWEK